MKANCFNKDTPSAPVPSCKLAEKMPTGSEDRFTVLTMAAKLSWLCSFRGGLHGDPLEKFGEAGEVQALHRNSRRQIAAGERLADERFGHRRGRCGMMERACI